MNEIKPFLEIAQDPYTYAANWKKKTGRKVVGYFCTYTPEELIVATGALPFRIFGTREQITRADAHLQAYSCSLVRGGLEDALSGRLGFLDGTVFPHTCDSIQRLSDIWRLNAGFPVHIDIVLPVKLDSPSAREYLVDVFRKFRRDIEKSLGPVSDESLAETIRLYNKIRGCFADIYRMRSDDPGLVSGGDLYAMIKSAMVMDRHDLLDLLTRAAEALNRRGPTGKKYRRIVLAGGVCNQPEIYSLIEKSGGAVIWDDLCTGARWFEGTVPETGDPVAALAGRYRDRLVCPAKHRGIEDRGANLVEIVKKHRAGGVVFLILKFCDPHSFDYPYMKELLDREKIPSMLLELEEQTPSAGQLMTRLETFMDLL